jgi:hypothetical protein
MPVEVEPLAEHGRMCRNRSATRLGTLQRAAIMAALSSTQCRARASLIGDLARAAPTRCDCIDAIRRAAGWQARTPPQKVSKHGCQYWAERGVPMLLLFGLKASRWTGPRREEAARLTSLSNLLVKSFIEVSYQAPEGPFAPVLVIVNG